MTPGVIAGSPREARAMTPDRTRCRTKQSAGCKPARDRFRLALRAGWRRGGLAALRANRTRQASGFVARGGFFGARRVLLGDPRFAHAAAGGNRLGDFR